MSLIVNMALLLSMAVLLVAYTKKMLAYIPVILVVLYQSVWLIISCAYCEQGIYFADTNRYAYFDFSTARLLLFTIAFYAGTILSLHFIKHYFAPSDKRGEASVSIDQLHVLIKPSVFLDVCILLCLAITAFLFENLAISGTILTNPSITRFNFYSTYSRLPLAQYLGVIQPSIFLFCGLLLFNCKSKPAHVFAIAVAFAQLLYYWLIGNEATAFMTSAIYLFTPWLINVVRTYKLSKSGKKAFRRAVVLVCILICIVLAIKYSSLQGHSVYGAEDQDSFTYRLFALQANTWWNTDNLQLATMQPNLSQLGNEISAFFGNTENHDYGIWYLMGQIMPLDEFSRYILGNGTLNAGYPAINVSIYGYLLGLLVTFFDGFVFFLFVYYLYRQIVEGHYVVASIAMVVFTQEVKVVTMGGIWYLGNSIPMLCIFLLLFWELISAWSRNRGGATA
jgi:hypothetical protein